MAIKDLVVAVVFWEMLVYQLIEILLDPRFHSFIIRRVEPDDVPFSFALCLTLLSCILEYKVCLVSTQR